MLSKLGLVALVLSLLAPLGARADTTYLAPDAFLREVFVEPPQPSVLWLDKSTQAAITATLGHPYPLARLRYWRAHNKSVWILDEIGKEYPITAGFVVDDARIRRAEVLIYRETRGMEIHLPAFLAQFAGNALDGNQLREPVDGITGATLSVDAMRRMASTALTLDRIALSRNAQ